MENNKSTLTYTAWGKTYSVELSHSDLDIDDLLNMFKSLAALAGWDVDTIENTLKEYGN